MLGTRLERSYEHLPFLAVRATTAAVAALRSDPAVVAVEPDMVFPLADQPMAPRAPAAAPRAAAAVTGAGWTVAVLDTGVDINHPYLAGKTSAGIDGQGDGGACFVLGASGSTGGCDGAQAQTFGAASAHPCTQVPAACLHGTHVAGIAVGNGSAIQPPVTSGVAPGAGLYPVRVFSTSSVPSDCGGGATPCAFARESDVLGGLNHVIAEAVHYRFAAVNLSLGGGLFSSPCSNVQAAIEQAIQKLHNEGIAVTVAAGNDGNPTAISFPACVKGAFAVGAGDGGVVDAFSDASAQLALVAPGLDVVSSIPGGGFAALSGTSMSAPAVAGAFALLGQARPTLNVDQRLAILRTHGDDTVDVRVQPQAHYPALDVVRALAALGAVPPPASTSFGFEALAAPVRLVDTRGSRLSANEEIAVPVAGRAHIPGAGAAAVSLNVTAVDAAGPGFLTVFPCGTARPLVSSVNYAGPAPVANKVAVALSDAGAVCIFTMQATDVIVDVDGWFPTGDRLFHSQPPQRVVDTRTTVGLTTDVAVAAAPRGAKGTVVNVTITEPSAAGFATVYPCGHAPPLASNVDFLAGETAPAAAFAAVDTSGRVCVHANVPVKVIVDVFGWLAGNFTPTSPFRVLDTRATNGPLTDVAVSAPAPPGAKASAAAINVTVTNPVAAGYLTVYPCGQPLPLASNLNYVAGQTIANAAIVRLPAGGLVCLHSFVPSNMIVDVDGWLG
jgi:subtilisin family serine protease